MNLSIWLRCAQFSLVSLAFLPFQSAISSSIYMWEDSQGNTVMSSHRPMEKAEYRQVQLTKLNISEQDAAEKKSTKKLSEEYQQHSEQQKQNDQKTNDENEKVSLQITEPADGMTIHSFAPSIAVGTSPKLSDQAEPEFFVNGTNVTDTTVYKEGQWHIERPNPGRIELRIQGTTQDDRPIESNETTFYVLNTNARKNQQSQN